MVGLHEHYFGRPFVYSIFSLLTLICFFGTLCILEGGEDETDAQDPFSQLDHDDHLSDIVLGMDIPVGVRLQVSSLPALDQFLVNHGVLVRFGLGWFGRVMTRRAHQSSRCEYDYRVVLHADGSTKKRKVAIGVVQH